MEPNVALKTSINQKGVPVIEDKNMDTTDLMKCVKALEKVEQAVTEVLFPHIKIIRLLNALHRSSASFSLEA